MRRTDITQRWLDALRSGEYSQGRGSLKEERVTRDGIVIDYCCLGVAAELCDALEPITRSGGTRYWMTAGDHVMHYLDDPTAVLIGFDSKHEQKLLAQLNDSEVPFDQIADKIEEMLDGEE